MADSAIPHSSEFDSYELDWPESDQFYLTLDFECDYGTALRENTYQAVEETGRLIKVLESHDVPLTCFVQTELLDEKPEAVETLRDCSTEVTFHPHSHTHRRRGRTSVHEEVRRSTARYREFFGTKPTGYRFPNGNVQEGDYRLLADYGYDFDASLFPSWRPNHFNNLPEPTVPQYLADYNLFELPFTVYSDWLRLPTALSYNRLLGRSFDWLLARRPPPVIVYNIHMHDLVTPERYADLSPTYRAVYGRNDCGFELLAEALQAFASSGYSFGTLDEVHTGLRDSLRPIHSSAHSE